LLVEAGDDLMAKSEQSSPSQEPSPEASWLTRSTNFRML
jgi:hypothetical protein